MFIIIKKSLRRHLQDWATLIINEYVLGISQKEPVIKIPAGGVYCPTTCSVSSPSSILNFSQDQAIIVIPTSLLNCTWDTMAPCTSITMICPAVVPKYTYTNQQNNDNHKHVTSHNLVICSHASNCSSQHSDKAKINLAESRMQTTDAFLFTVAYSTESLIQIV